MANHRRTLARGRGAYTRLTSLSTLPSAAACASRKSYAPVSPLATVTAASLRASSRTRVSAPAATRAASSSFSGSARGAATQSYPSTRTCWSSVHHPEPAIGWRVGAFRCQLPLLEFTGSATALTASLDKLNAIATTSTSSTSVLEEGLEPPRVAPPEPKSGERVAKRTERARRAGSASQLATVRDVSEGAGTIRRQFAARSLYAPRHARHI